jgi:1-acyl-sn-glycerol-3-phosphate acyltransferase
LHILHTARGIEEVRDRWQLRDRKSDVEVCGVERLTPGKTYIFVSNHQSIYDIPIIFWHLPWQLRIIAKESLGHFPFLGWHLSRTGHLLVDRKRPDPIGVLKRWKGLVAQGLSLIVFPEGTRSRDGRIGRFKAGSFLLAIQAELPLVPISVSGSRHVMLKGRMMTCPGHVRVEVHDPVPTEGLEATVEQARVLAGRVRSTVESGVPESVPAAAAS